MQMIRERRKSYSYIVFALITILIFSLILLNKYFALQKDYYKLLSTKSGEILPMIPVK